MPASLLSAASFVDLDVPLWAWVFLAVAILTMLATDLFRHRDDHASSPREALIESLVWIACGLGFSAFVALQFGSGAFGEYISGYLIEKSLSVDNVFVWSMLFTSMAIPLKYQHRVLFWGIFGALALRAAFVILGSALITQFWWVLLIFGVFLIYTGVKIFRHRNEGEARETTAGLRLLRRFVPVSEEFDGHRFFTKQKVGQTVKRVATPLFAALVVVEATDIIFAVDSVPAILAVSHETFIVLSSNAFAILGLRAMYFLLANAKEKFAYLSHALGGILVFVGAKMTISRWVHVNTYLSLAVIVGMLGSAVGLSLRRVSSAGVELGVDGFGDGIGQPRQ